MWWGQFIGFSRKPSRSWSSGFTRSGAMVSRPVRWLIWDARRDEMASRRTVISAHEHPSLRILASDSFSITGVNCESL